MVVILGIIEKMRPPLFHHPHHHVEESFAGTVGV
jgi:hypothetical protein